MQSWLPENISTFGGDIDFVILLIWYVVGAWFVLAFGLVILFSFLYRKKEGVRAAYTPARDLKTLSIVLIPTILVLGFDLTIDSFSHKTWTKVKIDRPEADLNIGIRGKQFVWQFVYPGMDGVLGTDDDFETTNTLYVPVNQVVQFRLSSEDVIHSFFVPNTRLKQDAVPGRTIPGWFELTKTGRYQIACAELCGLGHTNMRGWMQVMEAEEFESWHKEQAALNRQTEGE